METGNTPFAPAEDRALRGRNLSADWSLANSRGRADFFGGSPGSSSPPLLEQGKKRKIPGGLGDSVPQAWPLPSGSHSLKIRDQPAITYRVRSQIYSIMGSCHRYQIDPAKYLTDVLRRLPDLKQSDVPTLTPKAWAKAHPEARTRLPK